eukprot:CAMPEP_0169239494 /NCGR_PEP_ID=MMETSP1016-20121227/30943_1 /TAXON_ID=342587 /ORGANISM="Karlodinium micrum, Strain CCMP2283" /LENGTH=315 /DNA_ID=CAMNT_0009319435 /DNA_START=51 /DNA_END=999 /DNA_ORIENTATION=-
MGGTECKAGNPCGSSSGQSTIEFDPKAQPSRERYMAHGMEEKTGLTNDQDLPTDYHTKAELGKKHGPGGGDSAAGDNSVDSYSSNYFGREAAELAQVPLPPGGANEKCHREHKFRTGAVYNGQWLGRERHGIGLQNWADGASYHGQWEHNTATGTGRFQHNDGDIYIGEWRQNIAHGCGIYQHRDSTKYEGQFVNDLQDGYGIESWPDQSKFHGQFVKGKKSGYGFYTWPDILAMQAYGLKTRYMALANTMALMGDSFGDDGKLPRCMVWGNTNGPTDGFMLVNIGKIKRMALVFLLGRMDADMKDIGMEADNMA